MSIRDKIAAIMRGGIKGHASFDEVADAIVAALPDMIAPLVWRDNFARTGLETMYHLGPRHNGTLLARIEGGTTTRLFYEDRESAIIAANAHYRANIMAAFNQPKEDV